eukprot:s1207_g11.t2
MPEHIVVRCFSCKTHQAVAQNKKGKFACRLCGANQSVQHIIARGTPGKELRLIVQDLNYTKGKEAEAAEALRFQMEAAVEPLPLPAPEEPRFILNFTFKYHNFGVFTPVSNTSREQLTLQPSLCAMAIALRLTDLVFGVIYLCTYFLSNGPILNFVDQVGLILLIAGVLVCLGISIKIRLIGQMRWTFADKFFQSVMNTSVGATGKSDGTLALNTVMIVGQIIGMIISSVVKVTLALILGLLGGVLDIAVELLSVLAVLVPLGLFLGIQLKRRMAPAMLEVICPVLGRFGFFLNLALSARLLRGHHSRNRTA